MRRPIRLLKFDRVSDLTGLKMTSVYDHIKRGLFPPPVKLTERTSVWPENEVAELNAARIAGKSNDEIRELVRELVAARAALSQQSAAGR